MDHDKLIKYRFLMKLRKQLIFSVFGLPVFLIILLVNLLPEEKAMILTALISVPTILFCGFRLMAYDICPWCKSNFFVEGEGYSQAYGWFFRKKCACCGKPDQT